jgi:hypothetical protein
VDKNSFKLFPQKIKRMEAKSSPPTPKKKKKKKRKKKEKEKRIGCKKRGLDVKKARVDDVSG